MSRCIANVWCQDSTLKPLVVPLGVNFAGGSVARYCLSKYSRTLSHCKHDMGALWWLNAETLKRVPNPSSLAD